MANGVKRIPVSEELWKELNELKGADETYDHFLKELIQEHQRHRLIERSQEVREAESEELSSLDVV